MLSLFVPVTYAAEPTAVNPDPFGGPDKRPEKSENVMTVWNEDGTFTTSVVMTYGDGHKEHCIIKTVQSTKEHPVPSPISKICTRIRFVLSD